VDARGEFLEHFLRHQDGLKAFIGSVVPDPHLRADVFQEVSLTLWQAFDTYDPARPFGAWARGVALRKVLQHREKWARFPLAFSPEAIEAIADAFGRTERDGEDRPAALRDCLSRLPEKSRQILAWRYEGGLPGEEVARLAGMTLDALYQALSRLRGRLEECIRQRLAMQGV
jgi:RNA polymerase sigma-70 factor (ECF subfamily)